MKYLNKEFFKKLKGKIKLMKEKTIKKVSVLSLATVLLLTGCSVNQNINSNDSYHNNSNNNGYYNQQQENYSENTENSAMPTIEVQTNLSDEKLNLLEQEVSVSEQEYTDFISYLRTMNVEYENSQFFQIPEALEKYRGIKEYDTVSSNFIQNGKLDEVALREQVIKNNKEYLERTGSGRYSDFDKKTFEKVFSTLIEAINYQLQSGASIDIAQLDENLTNLRIFKMNSHGSGMVTDDGIFALNLDVIDVHQQQYPNVDLLRMVILHEGNHLVQLSSVKERENEGYSRNLGIAYSWDDLKVNPLLYTWYTEASAEYLKNFQYGVGAENAYYENQVKALEALTLSTILKEGVDEKTFAQLSLQPDLNKLFELFNCDTEADRLEVLQMMYAIEIYSNQPTEFNNFYTQNTGKNLEIYKYHDSLKASVGKTLTKKFYENLIVSSLKSNISLKDVFSMVSTFELEMSRLTKNNASFITFYTDIQQQYFTILAQSLNMNIDDLMSFYVEYYHDDISRVNQANVTIGEANFINNLIQSRTNFKNQTLSEMSSSKIK